MTAYEAYEAASQIITMLLYNQAEILGYMWDEIEKVPDDELIEIPAGKLYL